METNGKLMKKELKRKTDNGDEQEKFRENNPRLKRSKKKNKVIKTKRKRTHKRRLVNSQ